MPRIARVTAPGLVYHLTHRGNRREDVFLEREDRERYLRWLATASDRHGLEIWAFCLMTNHVHLVVRGLEKPSLARTMRELQGRYARAINFRIGWSGHLWANRFYSHPVDIPAAWETARYVECNPVRAGIVDRAERYPWSSARAHCGLEGPGILSSRRPFPGVVGDWSAWLEGRDRSSEARFREATRSGLPVGSAAYRRALELSVGRSLAAPQRGRPRHVDPTSGHT